MPTCIDGHSSAAEDYCDVCGAPMASSAAQTDSSSVELTEPGTPVRAAAPDTPSPASAGGWAAVVAADREFYERVLAREGPDTVEFPAFFPERRIALQRSTTLIGRRKQDQAVEPDIDLSIQPADRGVSSQHAVLRLRESGLTVTDLGSTNGTSLNGSDERLKEGVETPLTDGDRIHVGAWTTITIEQVR
ncbi:FHA domain-containing protein [Mycolicibacterium sp. XJ870]